MQSEPERSLGNDKPFHILVLGDVSLEDIFAPIPKKTHQSDRDGQPWESGTSYRRYRRRGGAWLVQEMIEAAVTSEKFKVRTAVLSYEKEKCKVMDHEIESKINYPYRNSATILGLYPRTSTGIKLEDKVYRIKQILGWVDNWKGCDLRLMFSVKDKSEIPKEGKARIIVATVDNVLHFRIFDGDGNAVVDTDENSLTEHARQLADLRKQLQPLLPPHELSESEKGRLITAVTSITNPDGRTEALERCLKSVRPEAIRPRILVFHDADGDFRRLKDDVIQSDILCYLKDNHHFEPDPPNGRNPDPGWVVWQMYSKLAEENLWNAFNKHSEWLDRTIVVVKADCLRQAGVNLADGISLERESQNFLSSIEHVNAVSQLVRARHLVVHFHRQGVMHYDREAGLKNSCYFCPYVKENPAQSGRGTMIGYTSILVAALVRGLTWRLADHGESVDGIIDGLKQGVILDHRHLRNGFANALFADKIESPHPYKELFSEIDNVPWDDPIQMKDKQNDEWRSYRLAALVLPNAPEVLSKWSRIEGFVQFRRDLARGRKDEADKPNAAKERAEVVAREIVRFGLKHVVDPEPKTVAPQPGSSGEITKPKFTPGTPMDTIRCPYEVRGKIKTADRNEIDSFSSILGIMQKYRDNEAWKHPLSIAVFGPPGSGKSFTIKQILEDVDPEIAKRPLEYNLAQFNGVEDLETAFHQVQDRSLADELPLVVFDEFDTSFGSERLGWLKYFLAPMQDGKFKAGESMYRIGRAIFVFSGGIAKTFSEFYDDQKGQDYFKTAKGSDFVSRLRGHLNIAGINVGKEQGSTGGEDDESQASINDVLMFRRAILLRSILEDHLKGIIDENTGKARIDLGVVRAFLLVKRYEHGARSMQAIIEMTQVSHRKTFLRSSLPSAAQLNMHVNAAEFLDLVNRSPVDEFGDSNDGAG